MRTGPGRSRKCSKSRGPSGHSAMRRCSASVKPEVTKSCGAPASSMVAMAPKRAPVSARALSTTSFSTVSRSRLALMRRLAALSAETRARSASCSAAVGSRSVIGSSLRPPRGRVAGRPGRGLIRRRTATGVRRLRFAPIPGRSRRHCNEFAWNSRKYTKNGHYCYTVLSTISRMNARARFATEAGAGRVEGFGPRARGIVCAGRKVVEQSGNWETEIDRLPESGAIAGSKELWTCRADATPPARTAPPRPDARASLSPDPASPAARDLRGCTLPFARRASLRRRLRPRENAATLLRGARACLALLAAAALLALAAPAQAQTEVWTATLTPGDLSSGILGCSNGVQTARCSSTSVLSGDSFNYDSTDYNITGLFVRSVGSFEFQVDADITTDTLAALTLVVGSTSLVLNAGTASGARTRIWDSSGVSLTAGTDIAVKLTAPVTNTAPMAANNTVATAQGTGVHLHGGRLRLRRHGRHRHAGEREDRDRADAGHPGARRHGGSGGRRRHQGADRRRHAHLHARGRRERHRLCELRLQGQRRHGRQRQRLHDDHRRDGDPGPSPSRRTGTRRRASWTGFTTP